MKPIPTLLSFLATVILTSTATQGGEPLSGPSSSPRHTLFHPTPRDQWLATPAHNAVRDRRPRALELLCAAGADLRARDVGDDSPLDDAFQQLPNHGDDACVRVLVANGVRLSTVSVEYRPNITPQVEAFERGVLRCRAAVVAMLHVKRASGKLPNWDRFLLRTLALDVWTTRHAPHWSQAAPLIVVDSAVRE